MMATLPRALAFAGSLLRDRGLSEDVVHDCYVRLLQKSESYDLARDGTKILFKAITNACIDRNYRDRTLLSLEAEVNAPIDSRTCEPAENLAHQELEQALALAMEHLTVAQRAAIELKSLGYSLAEIAEALGTNPNNAGVLVHRARVLLAQKLARFLEKRPDE